MNRAVFALAVICAMAVAGGLLFLLSRTSPPDSPAAVSEAPAAEPSAPAAPPDDAAARGPSAPGPPPAPAVAEAASAPITAGTVNVDSDVAGAQVFIDRTFVGEAPVTVRNVMPGTRRLNVEAPGYEGVSRTLDVGPGEQDVFVKLREVRLDASIAVEHRHGIGSCRGRLVATARGLAYEPTEGNDAFTVALTDLETFEVDYLEKNLRVKPRGGRQYNFSDPDDNADRLLVFRREVDEARQRLLEGDTPGE